MSRLFDDVGQRHSKNPASRDGKQRQGAHYPQGLVVISKAPKRICRNAKRCGPNDSASSSSRKNCHLGGSLRFLGLGPCVNNASAALLFPDRKWSSTLFGYSPNDSLVLLLWATRRFCGQPAFSGKSRRKGGRGFAHQRAAAHKIPRLHKKPGRAIGRAWNRLTILQSCATIPS